MEQFAAIRIIPVPRLPIRGVGPAGWLTPARNHGSQLNSARNRIMSRRQEASAGERVAAIRSTASRSEAPPARDPWSEDPIGTHQL